MSNIAIFFLGMGAGVFLLLFMIFAFAWAANRHSYQNKEHAPGTEACPGCPHAMAYHGATGCDVVAANREGRCFCSYPGSDAWAGS